MNTAREETKMGKRGQRQDFDCEDCGVDTSSRGIGEYYMVHDSLWRQAGMRVVTEAEWQEAECLASAAPHARQRLEALYWFGHDGMLCIGCLEERLGRSLRAQDFMDVPIHHLSAYRRSQRLTERLGR